MWPSKDEIEEHKKRTAFSRGFILGFATAAVLALLAYKVSADDQPMPPAPTGQQFCPIFEDGTTVLCAVVDVKEA